MTKISGDTIAKLRAAGAQFSSLAQALEEGIDPDLMAALSDINRNLMFACFTLAGLTRAILEDVDRPAPARKEDES